MFLFVHLFKDILFYFATAWLRKQGIRLGGKLANQDKLSKWKI